MDSVSLNTKEWWIITLYFPNWKRFLCPSPSYKVDTDWVCRPFCWPHEIAEPTVSTPSLNWGYASRGAAQGNGVRLEGVCPLYSLMWQGGSGGCSLIIGPRVEERVNKQVCFGWDKGKRKRLCFSPKMRMYMHVHTYTATQHVKTSKEKQAQTKLCDGYNGICRQGEQNIIEKTSGKRGELIWLSQKVVWRPQIYREGSFTWAEED